MTMHASLLLVLALIAQPEGPLVLRGAEPAPVGEVREITDEGVVVGSAVAASVVVGWDRVLEVRGEHADEARAFAQVSDAAWRATSRLQRGDVPAAEPLFERLFVDYRSSRGPTSAAVCEGLLRCRLERNAHTLAVSAWLSWLHARRQGDGPQWYQRRAWPLDERAAIAIDEATGLIGDLPPIWLDLPAVRVFAATPPDTATFGAREQALAGLYRHAARAETGESEPMPRAESGDEVVRLVWDIVAAQSPLEADRGVGRKAVEARLRKQPVSWLDAWLRLALGRSLAREADLEQRRRGVIELLRVRVTHERDEPYLAGMALAQAAVTLRELGDEAGASELRRELLDRFSGHPAAQWDRIVAWRPAGAADAERNEPESGPPSGRITSHATRESRTPHG